MKQNKLKYQRAVSLSLGLTFIVMFLSSGVLYFIPDRGVTAWSSWSFLGLDKQQWDNLHINLGLLFLVFLIWHIYYNWKPIKNYLKHKKEWVVFTKEFNFSVVLVSLFMIGTIWMILPFSFFVNIGNGIKAINAKNAGTPPFAYAEKATLKDYSILMHLNYVNVIKKLEEEKLSFKAMQTLEQIASENNISPRTLSEIILPSNMRVALPSDIPVGLAHKTLEGLEKAYRIDIDRFISYLESYGIKASRTISFKKLSKEAKLHPATLYTMLLASQIQLKENDVRND
jgi:membrane protein CcdC involved in cytochrome C biogenesis